MANYYLQHGAYGNYTAIPTWGVAQEGDGLGTGLSTPAIGSIVINSVAVATNTITVLGVTLTAVASGANATQFNVGASTSIQADNIATAINAATGLISSSISLTTHQLRNMVYARGPTLGAPANTVQIMTRVGGALFNSLTAIASSGFSSAPTLTQFSGGSSGVFGYFFNGNEVATVWPSAIAKGLYGILNGRTVGTGPLLLNTAITVDDTCYIRTNNITCTTNSANTSAIGIYISCNFIIDNGVIWSGDTGFFKIQHTQTSAGFSQFGARFLTNPRVTFYSKDRSRFIFELATTCQGTWQIGAITGSTGNSASVSIDGASFIDNAVSTANSIILTATGSVVQVSLSNIYFYIDANKFLQTITLDTASAGTFSSFEINGMGMNIPSFTTTPSFGLLSPSFMPGSQMKVKLSNISLSCPVTPYAILGSLGGAPSKGSEIVMENISGFLSTNTTLLGSDSGTVSLDTPGFILLQGVDTSRSYLLDTPFTTISIAPSENNPYLNTVTPSGDNFSVEVKWLGSLLASSYRDKGIQIFKQSITVLSGVNTTATLELLVSPEISSLLTYDHIGLSAGYIDNTTGKLRYAYRKGNSEAISTSSAAWTLTSYPTFIAVKLELVFPTTPKIGSEIDLTMKLHKVNPSVSGAITTFFINPEVILS